MHGKLASFGESTVKRVTRICACALVPIALLAGCNRSKPVTDGDSPPPTLVNARKINPANSADETVDQLGIDKLLPTGRIAVDVMEIRFPDRSMALAEQMQAAVRKDREWFMDYVMTHAKSAPGKPLPYDQRLGLTPEEYAELLMLGDQKFLVKNGTAELAVTSDGHRVSIDGGTALPELHGVHLDIDTDKVTTPFGETTTHKTIKASDGQELTGPWNGLQWKLEKGSERTSEVTIVRLCLGRLVKSSRGITYYEVKCTGPEANKAVTYILQYDLK
jgi:hypothetical protein